MVVSSPNPFEVSDDVKQFMIRYLSFAKPQRSALTSSIAADRIDSLEFEPFFDCFDNPVDVLLPEKTLMALPTLFVHVRLSVATEGKLPVFLELEQNLSSEEWTRGCHL